MYKLAVKENLDRKFKKLKKKDREMLVQIEKCKRYLMILTVSSLSGSLYKTGEGCT